MDERKLFGVRRNIFALGLVSFWNDISGEMVQSVMPAFLTTALGAPPFVVGLIEGVADAVASVLKVLSGWVSDVIRRRKSPAVLGYGISVGTRFFLSFAGSFYSVLGLRITDRIGKGLRDAPRDALIAESVPREELGRSYGFHRAMDTLGATIGPLLAFLLLPAFGMRYDRLFLVAFAIGILALGSFAFVRESPRRDGAAKERPRFSGDLFRTNRSFILAVLAIFVFGLGTLPMGLVLLKAKDTGFIAGIPLFYFIYSLAFVLVSPLFGRIADRIGERKMIGGGFLAAVAAYLGLAHASNNFMIGAFFALLGIHAAATDGMQRMLAAKSLPDGLLATGQGFLNMALGFSSLGAGVIGGLLWTVSGSSAALWYAAFFSLAGFGLFVIVSRRGLNPSHAGT